MKQNDIIQSFLSVKKWQKGSERAPHKPLTLLYALGELQRGKTLLPFEDAKQKIEGLLVDFGPNRKTQAIHPYVRLASDGIWSFNNPGLVDTSRSARFLIDNNIAAGFIPEIKEALKENPAWIPTIAHAILDDNFPESLHGELLNACGIFGREEEKYITAKRKQRDPAFREKILQAYSYKCAICGFQLRLGHQLIGVEAAHIKWHTHGGPDIENNGLALCSLHHKMLDSGVFSLDENLKLKVSTKANGPALENYLLPYEHKPIKIPRKTEYLPKEDFISWHLAEVFKGGY